MKKIIWWFKPPDKPLNKGRTVVGITVLLLLTTITVFAIGYPLLTQGSYVKINDAIYRSYTPTDASGSGVFDPFLRISDANDTLVQGYNTDWKNTADGKHEFPQAQDVKTTEYLLSSVPIVTDPDYPGVYREFQLDINQTSEQNISLDEVEIYLTLLPNLEGYDTIDFGGQAAKIYELDDGTDNWIQLNYDLASGSGKRDMILRVPDARFRDVAGYPYCEYTATSCSTYVVLYSRFGGDDGGQWFNNDGFEEWGTEIYELATKSGYKFNDLNHDGVKDGNEPGLGGWTIYVDINGNGQFDPGEPSDDTDLTGFYQINNIVPNPDETSMWKVREVGQSGWYCSLPADQDDFGCYYEENFAPGEVKTNNHFGNYQLILDVTKDANTTFTRTYNWSITKDFDATYSKFIGDPATTHGYEVKVTKTGFTDSDWAVSGNIYIVNNMPVDAVVSNVSDDISGGINPPVSCPGGLPQTLAANGGSLTCTYSSSLPNGSNRLNTVTVSTTGQVAGNLDTADVTFGDPTTEVNAEVNVTDTNGKSWGPVSETTTWNYDKDFTCSSNPADYVNGFDSYYVNNIATIDETGDWDDATVTVNCYAPVVDKDAAGTYDETHTWDIEKSVDPTSQSGFPGDFLDWTWTVDLSETSADSNFDVSGKIYVYNPAGDPMEITLADVVGASDTATIDFASCTNSSYDSGTGILTINAGQTAVCDYSALDLSYSAVGSAPTSNTATATLNGIDFSKTVNFTWQKTVYNGTADVDDDQESDFPLTVNAGDGPWQWTETQDHTCSNLRSDYGEDGTYGATLYNTATVTGSDGQTDSANADTTYTCNASFVDIYKTTNGEPASPSVDITFVLYAGETPLETISTLNNGASLEFQTALRPGDPYTICEYPVPAGYTMEVTSNGQIVPTYPGPPGEANPTGEIQCFDFTAGETGTTLSFQIDNRYPGGAPRTPGYWKNWSTCTGGNQVATAAKLGGVAEGVYLLDDLLPQIVGSFEISDCEVGVSVLDSRSIDKGKKMANDAAYKLARNLLAARLNQDAGACVPVGTWPYNDDDLSFDQVLTAADTLLTDVGFDGTGKYLDPKNKQDADLRADALYLAGIIDDYNNSQLCTGEPSH
jgi:hypothetical protein